MSSASHNQTYARERWLRWDHRVSVSLFLAAYGAVYLTSVILGGWTPRRLGQRRTRVTRRLPPPLLPRSYINPIFFVTSIPALFLGTVASAPTVYVELSPQIARPKEAVAILLTACGFAYQVIGAWPIGTLGFSMGVAETNRA